LSTSGEDHAFGAIWDQDWYHYEFFRGGFSTVINPLFAGMTNMQPRGNYGWTTSYVYGSESDGYHSNFTKYYTQNLATLKITVTDSNAKPVDGAQVIFWCNPGPYGAGWVSDGYDWTDANGTVEITVGAGKQYACQVNHPSFGWMPSSTQIYFVTPQGMNAIKDGTYPLIIKYNTKAMPQLKLVNALTVPGNSAYGVHVQFSANEIINGFYTDSDSSRFKKWDSIGSVTFFLCDSANYMNYKSGSAFDAYQVFMHGTAGNMYLPLPTEGLWYFVFTDQLLTNNFNFIDVTCELTQNAVLSGIKETCNIGKILVYPNPFNKSCTINLPEGFKDAEITDVLGRTVERFSDRHYNWIPWNSQGEGLYFIRTWNDNKVITDKVYFIKR
jgi:hypothetical protein